MPEVEHTGGALVEFWWEIGEQQFFVRIVVDDRCGQASLVPTVRAAGCIGDASQQALLGLRVLGDVEQLLDIGCYHLAALWTGDLGLRHEAYL